MVEINKKRLTKSNHRWTTDYNAGRYTTILRIYGLCSDIIVESDMELEYLQSRNSQLWQLPEFSPTDFQSIESRNKPLFGIGVDTEAKPRGREKSSRLSLLPSDFLPEPPENNGVIVRRTRRLFKGNIFSNGRNIGASKPKGTASHDERNSLVKQVS